MTMSKKTKAPAKKAAPAPKAKKVAAKPKAEVTTPRKQRNSISRPGEGTACRAIWDACDSLKAESKDISFDVLRAAIDSKVADATIKTQRQRWNKHTA
jgi:hypothetical protein